MTFVKMQHARKYIQFGAAQLGEVVIESAYGDRGTSWRMGKTGSPKGKPFEVPFGGTQISALCGRH